MARKTTILGLLCIWMVPAGVQALGLGDIHLQSALNQPFAAEIDLISAAPGELRSLEASLASTETFSRYGLDRPSYLSGLRFSVGRSGDGRDVLRVRSRQPLAEPFVTFLVEANWSRGRLLREYTVLLDPPVFMPEGAEPSAPAVAAGSARGSTGGGLRSGLRG